MYSGARGGRIMQNQTRALPQKLEKFGRPRPCDVRHDRADAPHAARGSAARRFFSAAAMHQEGGTRSRFNPRVFSPGSYAQDEPSPPNAGSFAAMGITAINFIEQVQEEADVDPGSCLHHVEIRRSGET